MDQPPVAPSYERDAWAEAHRINACAHAKTELRFKETSNGQKRYRLQCLACGIKVEELISSKLSEAQKLNAKPVNRDLEIAHSKKLRATADKINGDRRELEKKEFRSWYDGHLKSNEWLQKRDLVLKRANYLCEGCQKNKATQAHHLTYAHVGHELLFELVAVCNECHNASHFEPEAVLLFNVRPPNS